MDNRKINKDFLAVAFAVAVVFATALLFIFTGRDRISFSDFYR